MNGIGFRFLIWKFNFFERLYFGLLDKLNAIIFFFFIVCIYIQIKESDIIIPQLFNNNFFRYMLIKSEYDTSIIMSISTGYSVGFFIWFLDVYLKSFLRRRINLPRIRSKNHSALIFLNEIIISYDHEFFGETEDNKYTYNKIKQGDEGLYSLGITAWLIKMEGAYDGDEVINNGYVPSGLLYPSLKNNITKLKEIINDITECSDFLGYKSILTLGTIKNNIANIENDMMKIDSHHVYHSLSSNISLLVTNLFYFSKLQKYYGYLKGDDNLNYAEKCFLKYCGK